MRTMVVGKAERGDLKLSDKATLICAGKRYSVNVYSDRKDPKRRDVFPPRAKSNLPKTALVDYLGRRYKANLSFRFGGGDARIPVYQFRVSSPAIQ